MKLTISMQTSLDGVAQANGGNNEEMDPGFTRGGWALPLGDDEGVQYILNREGCRPRGHRHPPDAQRTDREQYDPRQVTPARQNQRQETRDGQPGPDSGDEHVCRRSEGELEHDGRDDESEQGGDVPGEAQGRAGEFARAIEAW